MNNITKEIEKLLLGNGASMVGFVDLSQIPRNSRNDFRYGIIFAIAIPQEIVKTIYPGPSMDYYNIYKEINKKLNNIGEITEEFLKESGYSAIAMTQRNVLIDQSVKRTDLPHKTVATRAGLGWIGNCALLVTEKYGSAIRLSTVLTDAKLSCGVPVNVSNCGDCEECKNICPAETIKGNLWNAGTERYNLMDFACCKDKIIERGRPWGLKDGMCGICIYACPYTKRYINKFQ